VNVKNVIKHILLTSATASVIAVLILAAYDVGRAYDLWVNSGWTILAWNSAMISPSMVKTIMNGKKNGDTQ
jgi:hypothetical protein